MSSNWVEGVSVEDTPEFIQACRDAVLCRTVNSLTKFELEIIPGLQLAIKAKLEPEIKKSLILGGMKEDDAIKEAEKKSIEAALTQAPKDAKIRRLSMTSMMAPFYVDKLSLENVDDFVSGGFIATHAVRSINHFVEQQCLISTEELGHGVTGGMDTLIGLGSDHLTIPLGRTIFAIGQNNGVANGAHLIIQHAPELTDLVSALTVSMSNRYNEMIQGRIAVSNYIDIAMKQVIVKFSDGDVSLSPVDCPALGSRIHAEVQIERKVGKKKFKFFDRTLRTDSLLNNVQSSGFMETRSRILSSISFSAPNRKAAWAASKYGVIGPLTKRVVEMAEPLSNIFLMRRIVLVQVAGIDINDDIWQRVREVASACSNIVINKIFDIRDEAIQAGILATGPDSAFLNGLTVGHVWMDRLAERIARKITEELKVRPDAIEFNLVLKAVQERVYAKNWN